MRQLILIVLVFIFSGVSAAGTIEVLDSGYWPNSWGAMPQQNQMQVFDDDFFKTAPSAPTTRRPIVRDNSRFKPLKGRSLFEEMPKSKQTN